MASVISFDLIDADKTVINHDLEDNYSFRFYQVKNTIKSRLCLIQEDDEYVYGNQSFQGETVGVVYSTGWVPGGTLKNGIAILDTYRKDMTPETVCEGLLFKVGTVGKHVTDMGYSSIIYTSAFWAATSITFYELDQNGNAVNAQSIFAEQQFAESADNAHKAAALFSVLDWAPLAYRCVVEDGDYYFTPLEIFGDYDNIKVVSLTDMRRIHTAVTMSGIKTELVVKSASK